jgi:hypothetical protein
VKGEKMDNIQKVSVSDIANNLLDKINELCKSANPDVDGHICDVRLEFCNFVRDIEEELNRAKKAISQM